jgi:hypothetical protein
MSVGTDGTEGRPPPDDAAPGSPTVASLETSAPFIRWSVLWGSLAPILLFPLLNRMVRGLSRISVEAYERPVFMSALPERVAAMVGRAPFLLVLAIVGLAGALSLEPSRRFVVRVLRTWSDGWDALEGGPAVRWLVAGVLLVPTWTFSAYAYNAYFGQAHVADRLILVALWLSVLWRPIMVLPFAIALSSAMGQLVIPVGGFSRTESDVLLNAAVLLGSFWLVRPLTHERRAGTFVFLLCCLLAVSYWASGLAKVWSGWLSRPHLNLLFVGAYANGWLGFVDPASIARVGRWMESFNLLLMIPALTGELAAILLLWNRRTLVVFPAVWIVFHSAVFALTGIFFWKWMIVEAGLLVFLLGRQRIDRLGIFTRTHFATSVVIILGSGLWMKPVALSWYDTPLTYAVKMDGLGPSGRTYALPDGLFQPYAQMFALGLFWYLSPNPQITGSQGVTMEPGLADTLYALRTPRDVVDLERDSGRSGRYDPEIARRFDRFISRYMRSLNERRDAMGGWRAWVQPPRYLWTFREPPTWKGEEPIIEVRVREVTTFFDGDSIHLVRDMHLRTVDVARGVGFAAEFDPTGDAHVR